MARHRILHPSLLLLLGVGWVGVLTAGAPQASPGQPAAAGQAQQGSTGVPTAPGVIKAEANLVLVDVVVTDKKGNYIKDLEAKDFHVYEDDKEQSVTSFSHASGSAAPQGPSSKRYLVLFFDDSTMKPPDQMRARQAAGQFIEKTVSADRLMAVADFDGAFRIGQNFTSNIDLLKKSIETTRFASVRPNEPLANAQYASLTPPSMILLRSDFAARTMLLSLRSLAGMLRTVPGRKTLILFSGGFGLNPERQAELTATIDAANKANMAIYPVDVRGLAEGTGIGAEPSRFPPGADLREPRDDRGESPFPHEDGLWTWLAPLPGPGGQRGGGGGGTGGGGGGSRGGGGGGNAGGGGGSRGGGGGIGGAGGGGVGGAGGPTGTGGGTTTGSRGGMSTTGNPCDGIAGGLSVDPFDTVGTTAFGSPYATGPCGNQPGFGNRNPGLVPPGLDSVATNQQVLYALANGTGGFTIFNTNDFLAGLEKISKELDEYYILGYAPPNQTHDGSCHKIRVKLDVKGTRVRFRNGYCDVKGPDILAGKAEGKVLEGFAAGSDRGSITFAVSAPYFYTSANVARVNLAMRIPPSALDFDKLKGKFHSEMNALGLAYREDGSLAARFSDTLKFDFEKKELKEFGKTPYPYQNTFNIAPGKYHLKIVLGAEGQKFGKVEIPLDIQPFDGKHLALSSTALSDDLHPVTALATRMEELLEEQTPLVVRGFEVVPSTSNRFRRDERVGLYTEVFEPLPIEQNFLHVGVLFNIIDRKTNQSVLASNTILVNDFATEGNPIIPVLIKVPIDKLPAGEYRLEMRARDSQGNASPIRQTDFDLD